MPHVRIVAFVFVLAIVAATLLAFAPALDAQFLNWDDDRNFIANTAYRGLRSDNLRWAWQTYHLGVWQPFAWMLFGIEHAIAGVDNDGQPNPFAYHVFGIALHTANALLLFALLVQLIRIARQRASHAVDVSELVAGGAAALLFAVHPLRTEAVVWVSAQPYLPAIFFYLLAAYLYIRGYSRRRAGGMPWAALTLTFICYVIAVLFKAVAISLPLVLLILDAGLLNLWHRFPAGGGTAVRRQIDSRAVFRSIATKLPYAIVAVVVAMKAAESKAVSQPGGDVGALALTERLIQSCYGLVFYVGKSLAPVGLSPFYEMPPSITMAIPRFTVAVGTVVTTLILLALWRRRLRFVPTAAAAYLVILLPNLGLVQISQQLGADRYAYLATVPLAALLAGAIHIGLTHFGDATRRMRWVGLVLGLCVATLSLVGESRRYARAWGDSMSLWGHALSVDPNSPHAHCMLGYALIVRGDYPAAESHLVEAIELRDDFSFAYSNLGLARLQLQDWDGAAEAFEKAIEVIEQIPEEDRAKTYFGLAIAEFETGETDRAWKHLATAQKLGIAPEMVERAIQKY